MKAPIKKFLFALALLATFKSQLLTAFAQGTALVGHWPLNGNVSDTTGRHIQSLIGTNFVWTSGTDNEVAGTNALALNPQNQADTWVHVINATDLQFATNDFTISYWVKKLVSTANYLDAYGIGRWVTGADPGQNAWTLLLNNGANNDQAVFAIESGTTNYSLASPNNLALNVWNHLIGVRRQSVLELYVNGVFVSQQMIPTATRVNDNSTLDFYIGSSASPGYAADAVYDDVQIYHGALGNGGVATGQTAGGQIAYLHTHPGQTVGPIEPLAGLVAWWPADNNAVDVVGGNNGTLTNRVTYVPGEVNQAFNFGTNSAMVLLTNSPALRLQNFTIEAWIKRSDPTAVTSDPEAVEGNALMFGYGSGGYSFAIGPDGRLLLTKVDFSDVISPTGVTDTNWHHVAVTTTNGAVVFYVDGLGSPAGNYNVTYQFNTSVAIGGRADNVGQNNNDSFLGAVDELSVYGLALSAAEIQSIYQAGTAGKYSGDYISAPAPDLNIARSSSSIIISWPALSTGYTLQQNTNLMTSAGWTEVGFSITTANGTNSITFTPTTGSLFFRLANP
jgi:hypothetical protein